MDKVIVNADSLSHIANAIREASQTSDIMRLSEMPEKIRDIVPRDVKLGEYIPESDVSTFKTEHHLGGIPYMVIIWKDDKTIKASSARVVVSVNGPCEYSEEAGRVVAAFGVARGIRDSNDFYTAVVVNQETGDDGYGDTEAHFFAPSSPGMKYFAGEKYRWMAVGF